MDVRNSQADKIIGRSLITAETVASELRERLVAILSKSTPYNQWRLIEECRAVLAEYEPLLAETFSISDVAAWIAGFDSVAGKAPEQLLRELAFLNGPPREPPKLWLPAVAEGEPIIKFPLIEKAAESLMERSILTRSKFDRLTDSAKSRAFTMAGENSTATLTKIRDVLAENVEQGTSLRGFKARLREEIDTSEIGPAHLETVYRTNVQAAFSEGHDELASNPIVQDAFPYRSYLPIHDGRCREEHAALEFLGIEGTNIYRAADPFWEVFSPPWDFNCRCGSSLMTIEAAQRAGLKEAARWERTGIEPQWESRLNHIPFRPPPGFNRRAA